MIILKFKNFELTEHHAPIFWRASAPLETSSNPHLPLSAKSSLFRAIRRPAQNIKLAYLVFALQPSESSVFPKASKQRPCCQGQYLPPQLPVPGHHQTGFNADGEQRRRCRQTWTSRKQKALFLGPSISQFRNMSTVSVSSSAQG